MSSRRVRPTVLFVALVATVAACASPVAYGPNTAALEGMTRDRRDQVFVETLSRAAKPRIQQIWVDDAAYGYDAAIAARDGFGIPVGYVPRRRIVYFANVGELRLYDNDAVFVFDTSDQLVDKLAFRRRDDAERMIDLIASFRAQRYASYPDRRDEAERRHERRPRPYRPPPPYDPRYDRPPPDAGGWDGPPPWDDRPY